MAIPVSQEPATKQNSEEKTDRLLGFVEQLVAHHENHQEFEDILSDLLDEKVDRMATSLEQQLKQFQQSITSTLAELVQAQSAIQTLRPADPKPKSVDNCSSESPPPEPDSHLSNWEKQKLQFMKDQGFEPEPATAKPELPPVIAQINSADLAREQDEDMEALHDSIESIEQIDSEEIEELREILSSKLRDAEIELSINRAKLSQQWAALEQKQYELSQQEAIMKSKYGEMDEGNRRKSGILDRLSRHLKTRKSPDKE